MWNNESTRAEARERFPLKEQYSFEELLELMAFLRSPIGCPWDREQTHESIKSSLIEEAWESLDALESQRPERLQDELGDLLLQVVFHAQIAADQGDFTIDDIISGLCRKLISRHTHLFSDDSAADPESVLNLWDKNKKKEKGLHSATEVLEDIPLAFPALARAHKLQKKAAKYGFDWPDAEGPKAKITEELAEVEAAEAHYQEVKQQADQVEPARPRKTAAHHRADSDEAVVEASAHREAAAAKADVEKEAGDLLFAVVNYLRKLNISPELALHQGNQKFLSRFRRMEALMQADHRHWEDMDLEEMDHYWDQAKAGEHH